MSELRLFYRIFSLALRRDFAHRANLFFGALMAGVDIAASLVVLRALFAQVHSLAGWTLAQAIILLGGYQAATGLLQAFVEPNLVWFAEKIARGEIDDFLLQPVSGLFMASFGTSRPLALVRTFFGCGLLSIGLMQTDWQLDGFVGGTLLFISGLVLTWATRMLVACLGFWAPGFEPSVLYTAFWQFGRYPVGIYPKAVGWLLRTLVPLAVVSSVPLQSLCSGFDLGTVFLFVTVVLTALLGTRLVWRAGLRRYSGATS